MVPGGRLALADWSGGIAHLWNVAVHDSAAGVGQQVIVRCTPSIVGTEYSNPTNSSRQTFYGLTTRLLSDPAGVMRISHEGGKGEPNRVPNATARSAPQHSEGRMEIQSCEHYLVRCDGAPLRADPFQAGRKP